MPWVLRGLRDGVVTTRYPKRPDGYGGAFRGMIQVREPSASGGLPSLAQIEGDIDGVCPTGAVRSTHGDVHVDRGLCILCGRCVEQRPDLFTFDPSPEAAALHRHALVVPIAEETDQTLDEVRSDLAGRVRALRRSIHIRHVDAGSDGSEEWEIAALNNPVYDIQRLGIFFTASPRHADLLLVTGTGTLGMAGPLRRTYEALPVPKIVIAAGTDATSGGIVHPTYATSGGIGDLVPVDVWVPGSPPSPFSLMHAILLGIGLLPNAGGSR
jgi:Ni,Fe-hydrogenase III small subunit/ferredoxin